MPDTQFPEIGICAAAEPLYDAGRIVADEAVEGTLPERAIRDGVRGGGAVKAVLVVVGIKHGRVTYLPLLRVSWLRGGYVGILLRRGGARTFIDFTTMLRKLRGDPDGEGEDAGFGYLGPLDVVYPDDPRIEKLGPAKALV